MKISFFGAAQTVTGSKHLITLNSGTQILLDCGLFQGMGPQTETLNTDFGFDAASVNYLFLSHAHIDHTGLIPKLVKEGFNGKIFCTAATKDLSAILLEDSAKIQENEANKNRNEETDSEPYYVLQDVINTMPLFNVVEYDEWTVIEDGLEIMLTDTGHILGSAAINMRITENEITKQITFTGDIGRYRDAILCAPKPFPQADYIIMESTYGDKLHDAIFGTTDQLMKIIKETCIKKGGKLLIPAFSIGRTQELLYFLNQLSLEKRLPLDIPVIVDSPLSMAATNITKRYKQNMNDRIQKVLEIDDDPFHFENLHYTKTVEDSMKIKELTGPAIIIAASGMADAGRIKHHILHGVEDPRNTILIAGYCAPFTLGGQLMRSPETVMIMGKELKVNAEIMVMRSMSAHGDYDDLQKYLSCQDAALVTKIFLVHGEMETQQELQKKLSDLLSLSIQPVHQ
jgi:metallo-beta-lactamase family protein